MTQCLKLLKFGRGNHNSGLLIVFPIGLLVSIGPLDGKAALLILTKNTVIPADQPLTSSDKKHTTVSYGAK